MPKFHVYVLEKPHDSAGEFQEWDLPWERLVFDQRFEHPVGAEDAKIYKVVRVHERVDGSYIEIVEEPGLQSGGNPKKDRPPYRR
ncbi:MAG: hypothetical protein CSA62_04730 [Planctomycetota bacterium]|nr:MAG: hypothetical protein CSA62_04730 [Planctomycetota bacterium]